MERKHRTGDVVWAVCTDRSGKNSKERPLLILEIAGDKLFCLCISTDPANDPKDPAKEIAWAADGNVTTGLREWCRVVLKWQIWISVAEVTRTVGSVPRAYLRSVIAEREAAIHSSW